MTQRLDYTKQAPELTKKLVELSMAVKRSELGKTLLTLVDIRSSQLNGCPFCLDMHVKEAKIHGERELRIYHVAIWRESPLFDARERAALGWTEALTKLDPHGVSDEVYAEVRAQFSEKEMAELTYAVMTINSWNRASIAFRVPPGSADAFYGLDKANLS